MFDDEGIELTDRDIYDLNDELEATTLDSVTTRTLLDPEWDFSTGDADPPEVIPPDIPARFQTFVTEDPDPWSLLAEDCALTLSNNILSGRQPLRSLVDTGLIFRIETVSAMIYTTINMYRQLGIEVPADVPDSSDIVSRPDSIAFLVAKGLQTVAYTYLTKVWRSVDQLLYNRDPSISDDTPYSSYLHYSIPVSPGAYDIIEAQTTWDFTYGYPFWHTMRGSNPDLWFKNTTSQYILQSLLTDTDSPARIAFPEVTRLPIHPDDVMLVDPAQLYVVEKVAFAYAWIVVELRARGLSSYSFRSTPVLSVDRVLCVAREYALIEEFLDQVSGERTERGIGFATLCTELVPGSLNLNL